MSVGENKSKLGSAPILHLNRSSKTKRGMASNSLFIIPDFFLNFPNELCYGYLRFDGNEKFVWEGTRKKSPFSLPSQRNFPISCKPKPVATQ